MSDDFYRRIEERERQERNARLLRDRPENLHDYQSCKRDEEGHGPLSDRPATCTVGETYTATDVGQVFECLALNTWTARRKSMDQESVQCETPMPKYRCHKEVWALKILRMEPCEGDPPGMFLYVEAPFAPIMVPDVWVGRFKPEVGGYYVTYRDGYTSFSPAKAFEEGYTLVSGAGGLNVRGATDAR